MFRRKSSLQVNTTPVRGFLERNTVLVIIAGIFLIALVISYAEYCFYATAEMIKATSERRGINLQ